MSELSIKVPATGRNVDEVLRHHALSVESLENKTILDIGCGRSDLQADLLRRNVSAFVIGLEIDSDLLARNQETSIKPYTPVEASGSALPFVDCSFDIVLATYSLPIWARSEKQISSFFSEAKRVLKPGGILSVYPIAVSTRILDSAGASAFHLMTLSAQLETADILSNPNWFNMPHDPEGLTVLKVE